MNDELLRIKLLQDVALQVRNAQLQSQSMQTRFIPCSDMNLRFEEKQDLNKPFIFEGYAVRWDSINTHGEKFIKGAFADFINAFKAKATRCHMYYNHGWQLIWVNPLYGMRIGNWLEFEEDDVGLRVKGRITPRHTLANDVRAMLEDETIDGLSIAFYPPDPMDVTDKGDHVEIRRVGLGEISVCDDPSDRGARIDAQDVRNIESEDDLKKFLARYNIDEAASSALIQRMQSLNKSSDQQGNPAETTIKADAFAWLDGVS